MATDMNFTPLSLNKLTRVFSPRHIVAGNIEIIRCPDGYEVGDVYCTKSDTGVVDYDAQYPFETASYIARDVLRKVQVRK